jgi:ectoine hydroxylase-related dioxygenase (phytanoyl-CoA dioxygenase family)
MFAESDLKTAVDRDGFAIVDSIVPNERLASLLGGLERISDDVSVQKRGGIFAVRNLLEVVPEVNELAGSAAIKSLVQAILGVDCFPVRGILFDKIPNANWKVPWHQDVTIAVQAKIEAKDFGPWSVKADVLHVQPPASILENMISVRIHIDDCAEDNGALRVIPGSHRRGRIPEKEIPALRAESMERVCPVCIGGALLMRPLLLHASSTSRVPRHRRVVHIDFASVRLPSGMRWLSEPLIHC